MPMTNHSRKAFVRTGLAVCAILILFADRLFPSKLIAALAQIGLVIVTLLLWKYAAKWQLFQMPPWFPVRIPQVRAEWRWRTLAVGLLCLLGSVGWVTVTGLAIKYNTWGIANFRLFAILLVMVPMGALMMGGFALLWKGIYSLPPRTRI